MIPYDVQILGGIFLHYGSIAEMQTGEGKTLTASMPLYLNALTGQPVHLGHCERLSGSARLRVDRIHFPLFGFTSRIAGQQHTSSYAQIGISWPISFMERHPNLVLTICAITRWPKCTEDQCQRGYYFAIVDEIDSILIDEARTPLIISGPTHESTVRCTMILKSDPVTHVVKVQRDLCNRWRQMLAKSSTNWASLKNLK